MQNTSRVFVGDFETTVYEGQTDTEVWASACVELFTEDVKIFHSIKEQFDYFLSLKTSLICYYHNLKFDGNFWLSFLLKDLKYTQAIGGLNEFYFLEDKDMPDKSFKYLISNMGQWYSITIKVHNHYIVLRDSLKLLPFSVRKIGKSFGTKHKKLDMEYSGYRYAGCEITDEEKSYIANDVLVVKEALEIMYNEGHKKLTIGSCCLNEYRKTYSTDTYNKMFPDLYAMELDPLIYDCENAGEYIRKAYKGGWCYLAKGKENKIYHNGTTADVNSLYPSMMSSESGNSYPIGYPYFVRDEEKFWKLVNSESPDKIYWFIRIKTRFELKPNMLPCIQIKRNPLYKANEWLETSDIYNSKTGEYHRTYLDTDGIVKTAQVVLTLTQTDYKLIQEHYKLYETEFLDGCMFEAQSGIFDEYIEKYKQMKITSKGARRELAKLFLNNLYGKMASSKNSSFKIAYLGDDDVIGFKYQKAFDKVAGYIPCGCSITSYARNFTIRSAQKNYHGKNKAGFIYADTDSIHCDLKPDEITGIEVHERDFCKWKLESCWDDGIFVRQKTYIEHVTHEDLEPIEKPYYNIKCAGMTARCKELLNASLLHQTVEEFNSSSDTKLTPIEEDFISTKRGLTDFKTGLIIPSKLRPQTIKGGVILVETNYEMRDV